MDQDHDRKIDLQLASLDGGIFPPSMRHDREPLIDFDDAAPFDLVEPAHIPAPHVEAAPVAATPQEVAWIVEEPAVKRQPFSDAPAAHSISIAPPPLARPRHRRNLTAAGLLGGVLLTSLCAMAFQGSLPAHSRIAVASGTEATPKDVDLGPEAMPEVEAIPETTREVAAPAPAAAPPTEVAVPPEVKAEPVTEAPAKVPAVVTPARTASDPTSRVIPAPAAAPVAPIALPAETQVLPNSLTSLARLPPDIDRSAAALAIALAGGAASACTEPGDPRGPTPVSVTFAPSGRVTSARIEGGPFQGTSTGSCIARTLRSATVHPFDGAPATVHGTVNLR